MESYLRPDKLSLIWVSETSQFFILFPSSGHILEAANCTFDNVVKTTVLLADINDFGAVNEVYTTFFSDNYPARAAYQVGLETRLQSRTLLSPTGLWDKILPTGVNFSFCCVFMA